MRKQLVCSSAAGVRQCSGCSPAIKKLLNLIRKRHYFHKEKREVRVRVEHGIACGHSNLLFSSLVVVDTSHVPLRSFNFKRTKQKVLLRSFQWRCNYG
jgi:hypothetical protein